MESLGKCSLACHVKDFFIRLFQLRIRSDYDVNVSVYKDGQASEPSSTHKMSGSCNCKLIKLMAILSIIVLAMCELCTLCTLIRKKI